MTRAEFTALIRAAAIRAFPGILPLQVHAEAKARQESFLSADSPHYEAGKVEISQLADQYQNPFGIKYAGGKRDKKLGRDFITLRGPTEPKGREIQKWAVFTNYDDAMAELKFYFVESSNYVIARSHLVEAVSADIFALCKPGVWEKWIVDFESVWSPTAGHVQGILRHFDNVKKERGVV